MRSKQTFIPVRFVVNLNAGCGGMFGSYFKQ